MTSLTLGFELEWFDSVSQIMKTLFLKYFIDDRTIEILQDKKTFLKRIFYEDISVQDFYLGNSVTM